MRRWKWISEAVVLAIHEAQIAEHGGLAGGADRGLLEAALHRPRNLAHYGKPDAAELASAYIFGISSSHPFADGNKRTALVVGEVFLADNGFELICEDDELLRTMLAVAAGSLTETKLAKWIRERLVKAD